MSLSQNERINEKIYKKERNGMQEIGEGERKKENPKRDLESRERREIFPDTKIH